MNCQYLRDVSHLRPFGEASPVSDQDLASRMRATQFPCSGESLPVQVLMREGLEDARWRAGLEAIGKSFGAAHVAYGYGSASSIILPFWSTLPQGFLERYMEDECYARDNLATSLAASARPLSFDGAGLGGAFDDIFIEMGGRYGLARPSFGVPLIGTRGNIAGVAFYGVDMPQDRKARARLIRSAEVEVQKFHHEVMRSSIGWGWLGAPEFSGRELRCLYMASSGYGSKEMASALDLSQRSIDAALITARKKLDASSYLEAVAQAVYRRLVRPTAMEDVLGLPAEVGA